MYVGVDYYPEHWDRKRWPVDARLMKRAGFNVVRLAEFAWVNMEPVEERYDFAWLDEALAVLGRNGISAILGTPTAVMPAWLARKYPETLAVQKDGQRIVWGVRKNNCFSSGTYRLFSERITRAMAEHFSGTPNVIGWQTDNEFGGPVCHCDTCRKSFQDWLRRKYGTIEKLNRAWGNHFWGHHVRAWDEIVIPIDPSTYNPSACLDWQRHFSWLNVRFQREQVRVLRAACPRHFVTHNFMGFFHEIDYYDLAEDLDFVSWDNYPVWTKPAVCYHAAGAADLMRGLKKKNFWIMETNAGPGGWSEYGRNPRPGELRRVAHQQVARGADGYLWFRWRTCTAGREQYWHGLLGHDGKPFRRYREARRIAGELHALSREIDGTTVRPRVAILHDYDNIWALRIQPGFAENSYHAALAKVYDAAFRAGVNVDFIRSTDDFSKYSLILAPGFYIMPDATAMRLYAFVKKGGVLFADCRLGVKDETGLCHPRTLPGLLSDALGIRIEEYEGLGAAASAQAIQYTVNGLDSLTGDYTAIRGADWVTCTTAEPLARYREWHMKQFAAVTRNHFGKGIGYYLGTVVKEEGFYDLLLAELLRTARIQPLVKPPAGVEVSVRQGRGKRLLFLVNHTEEIKRVAVPRGKLELIGRKRTGAELILSRNGVAVIRL